MPENLTTPEGVQALLGRVGLVRRVTAVRPLGGGVSGDVTDVTTATDRLVVKVALPRLKVPEDWFASVSRAAVERRAIQLAWSWTPGRVPEVLGWDDASGTLVLRHLGDEHVPWKGELLADRGRAETGHELAQLLAQWQRWGAVGVEDALGPESSQNFEDLRTRPFYRVVADRLPEVAGAIDDLIGDSELHRSCLVHGDFSPKNIMIGPSTVVLDWEVAHLGDPAYDPGFLASHLALKALARPEDRVGEVLNAFVTGWNASAADPPWERIWRHAGAMMLARVHGRSRVDYLSPGQAGRAITIGRALLIDPPRGCLEPSDIQDLLDQPHPEVTT